MKTTIQAKNIHCRVRTIEIVAPQTYLLSFLSPFLAHAAMPGQFLHVRISEKVVLRRPFSIHKIEGNEIFILFKAVGRGTQLLAQYRSGDAIDIIGPLGNGFCRKDIDTYSHIFLVAGGMGVAPLVFLSSAIAREVMSKRVVKKTFLGAKTKKDLLSRTNFTKNSCKVIVATEDGSFGFRGTVLDALKKELEKLKKTDARVKVYTCGPAVMIKACARILKKYPFCECEVSFEQFMGCGTGICLGCVIATSQGYKRVCKDGPVFDIKKVF